jgi:DNA-binding response OmpR family regulator
MKNILVIDDENPVRDVLNIVLTEKGYNVYEATDGKIGIKMFMDETPDIVLTDVKMPEMSGIEVTKNIKEIKADADVVVMTGYGTEELVIEALRSGASNYIKKPIRFTELFNILDNIILKRENRKRFEVNKEIITYEKKSMLLENDLSKLWGSVNQVLLNLPSRIDDRSIEGIKLGLYELLVNAIEHGNLGITYDDKKEALENNTYGELVTERLNEAKRRGKKVRIESTYDKEKVVIEIHDQGQGFDYKQLPALSDPEAIMAAHGRGILLASLYYDTIEYRKPGNTVVLTKKIPQ